MNWVSVYYICNAMLDKSAPPNSQEELVIKQTIVLSTL